MTAAARGQPRARALHTPMRHVVVHSLAEASAALQAAAKANSAVTLHSPPDAALFLGPGYFLTMIDLARRNTPSAGPNHAVLDCGSSAGHALASLRAGAEAVRLSGDPASLDKVADIARQLGAQLLREPPPDSLD